MELNRDNLKKIRGLIVFTVAAAVLGVHYQKVLIFLGECVSMISPFLLGGAIAFVLNVPMRTVETRTPLKKMKRFRRPVCLILSVASVTGVLLVVIFVVGPELVSTVVGLQKSIPLFFEEIQTRAQELFARNPWILMYIEQIDIDWEETGRNIMEFLSSGAGTMVASTFHAAASIISGVANFCIGFVFAVYVLLQKEVLARQTGKLLEAYLPDRVSGKIIRTAVLTEKTFSYFLAGQCVEAVILGAMFFVTLTLMRLPYALLIGVLIAFTALIPIFGAFVGCAVGAFLILMVNPVQALVFLVVFQVLQQVEGNLIYPHVVGGSVGLPSIWVLVAVTVGGSAMGVLGMLVFIPLSSVLYALIKEEVHGRLERKRGKSGESTGHQDRKDDGSQEEEDEQED
ncbi:MAG: AI-2E family transporter [Hungatella sp.]|nr:AI-2E family transporter [Hungatella sp.]